MSHLQQRQPCVISQSNAWMLLYVGCVLMPMTGSQEYDTVIVCFIMTCWEFFLKSFNCVSLFYWVAGISRSLTAMIIFYGLLIQKLHSRWLILSSVHSHWKRCVHVRLQTAGALVSASTANVGSETLMKSNRGRSCFQVIFLYHEHGTRNPEEYQ